MVKRVRLWRRGKLSRILLALMFKTEKTSKQNFVLRQDRQVNMLTVITLFTYWSTYSIYIVKLLVIWFDNVKDDVNRENRRLEKHR